MPFIKKTMHHSTSLGEYEYQELPLGLYKSSDVFQEKINELY